VRECVNKRANGPAQTLTAARQKEKKRTRDDNSPGRGDGTPRRRGGPPGGQARAAGGAQGAEGGAGGGCVERGRGGDFGERALFCLSFSLYRARARGGWVDAGEGPIPEAMAMVGARM